MPQPLWLRYVYDMCHHLLRQWLSCNSFRQNYYCFNQNCTVVTYISWTVAYFFKCISKCIECGKIVSCIYLASVGQEKILTKCWISLNSGIVNQSFTVLMFLCSVFHHILSFSRGAIPWRDRHSVYLSCLGFWLEFLLFPTVHLCKYLGSMILFSSHILPGSESSFHFTQGSIKPLHGN